MYFDMKSYLKNTHNHTTKYILGTTTLRPKPEGQTMEHNET